MRTIETKTARGKLPVSKVPVFERLGQGVSIGYRRNAGGAGVWIVRLADGKRGKIEKRIALADDAAPANGRSIMSYQQAAEAARRLGRGETEEANPAAVVTLADAIESYKADLIARGAGVDNVTRLMFNLTPTMLKRPVALLDMTELRKWRDAAVKRMTPASVNRLVTILKAVLNLAATRDEQLSTRPWEIGLGRPARSHGGAQCRASRSDGSTAGSCRPRTERRIWPAGGDAGVDRRARVAARPVSGPRSGRRATDDPSVSERAEQARQSRAGANPRRTRRPVACRRCGAESGRPAFREAIWRWLA